MKPASLAEVYETVEGARGVVWLEPKTTVEVEYNELMQGRLRDAVLRGVRAPDR